MFNFIKNSIKHKLTLTTLFVVLAPLIITVFVSTQITYSFMNDSFRRQIIKGAQITQKVIKNLTTQKLSFARLFAENHSLQAALQKKDTDVLLDFESEYVEIAAIDRMMITDANGIVISSLNSLYPPGTDISQVPTTKAALNLSETAGLLVEDNQLIIIATVPIFTPEGTLLGTIGLKKIVDEGVVSWIKQMSGSEITFLLHDKIFISTIPITKQILEKTQKQLALLYEIILSRLQDDYITDFSFTNEPWLSNFTTLYDTNHNIIGMLVVGHSRLDSIAAAQSIRNAILVITILALLFAIIVAFYISSRFTRPIRALVKESDEISRGHLDVRVNITTDDELGRLASSFNKMAITLQESQTQTEARTLELKKAMAREKVLAKKATLSNRAKTSFLANVSHEIRTPLNCIIGFSEIILRSSELKDIHTHGQSILNESESLLILINDLLDHAKIESGKLDLEPHAYDLHQDMHDIFNIMQVKAKEKNLKFKLHIDPEAPHFIIADSYRIKQIIMNLLSNAIKFTNKGTVTLGVGLTNQTDIMANLYFFVNDTGIGIPKDKQANIFKSFTQADETTSRKYGGTGLGVTISHQLIKLMNGEIGVESEPGKGSRFWFTLTVPLCEISDISISTNDLPDFNPIDGVVHEQLICGNILVVEDYPANQEMARMHLENAGHRCTIAANSKKALELCKNNYFSLILMDLQLPETDGHETSKLIRANCPLNSRVPIIAMTANADKEALQACRASGMNDIITKPIRYASFIAIVKQYLMSPPEQDLSDNFDFRINMASDQKNDEQKKDTNNAFNYETALKEFANNKTILDTAFQQFISTVKDQIDTIKDAIKHKEMTPIQKEAHKIKGGASNLTATGLSMVASVLEKRSSEKNIEEVMKLLPKLEEEYNKVVALFESLS